MSRRFILSPYALSDLNDIIAYVQALPERPGIRLGSQLRQTLYNLAKHPDHGQVDESYSLLVGEEIRRWVSEDYVFFYAARRVPIVFNAVLHGARDIDTIMRKRFT